MQGNKRFLILDGTGIIVLGLDLFIGYKELLCNKGFGVIGGEYYQLLTKMVMYVNRCHLLPDLPAMCFVCDFFTLIIHSISFAAGAFFGFIMIKMIKWKWVKIHI